MTDGRPAGGSDAEVAGAEERTRLAWRRTVLSALVVGLLAVSKLVVSNASSRGPVAVGLILISWLALLGVAHRRMTTLRAGRRVLVNRSPALVALLVIGYVVLGLILLP